MCVRNSSSQSVASAFLVAKSCFEIVRTFITFFFIVFDLLTIVLFSDVFFVESEADNFVFLRMGVCFPELGQRCPKRRESRQELPSWMALLWTTVLTNYL